MAEKRLLPLVALLAGALVLGPPPPRARAQAAATTPTTAPLAPSCSTDATPDPRLGSGTAATAAAYVAQFYPLWFTYYQAQVINQLVGPDEVTPLYNVVVAVNTDTIYASAFLDMSTEPLILSIPSTPGKYSILTLDPYGDIYKTTLQPSAAGGVYALIGPDGYTGTLPAGAVPVAMPFNAMTLIFRADRFSSPPPAEDQTQQASTFRQQLRLQTRTDYLTDFNGGATKVEPERKFAFPFKLAADTLVAEAPASFLRQLQRAVKSSRTPALTADQQALSDRFNTLFGNGTTDPDAFARGTQAAHALIVDSYRDHTGPTNWVHFCNIGNWSGGTQAVERSAITEFCQYCNDIGAAAYYHAFVDGSGQPLTGERRDGYVIHFPSTALPQFTRFWSLTAYTPNTVELIPNPAKTYTIASYTPKLHYDLDGSLSIYLSVQQPAGVPPANWLPVSPGAFNVMLRIYGPVGDVSDDPAAYHPPAIQRR